MNARELVEKIWDIAKVPAMTRRVSGPQIESLLSSALDEAIIKCVHEHANASRVIDWMKDPKRKPAITAFTEGPERQIAYEFERVLASALDEAKAHADKTLEICLAQAIAKARDQAYEDAAKMVEDKDCSDSCLSELRDDLRQKAKEVGKQ